MHSVQHAHRTRKRVCLPGWILSIDPNAQVVISAEVCIGEKGEVTYTFDTPGGSALDASLLIQNDGKHGYVKGMVILGMQIYLESMTEAR
jgi:hypothetical protein